MDAGADRDDGKCGARRIEKDFTFSDGEGPGILVQRHTDPGASRVAHGNGSAAFHGGFQHVLEFVFILRRHDDEVRNGAEEGEVKQAVMGGAVRTNEAAPVHRQNHRQFLQADVVDHLIVGPLHEGGIDRNNRDESLGGEPGGKSHSMLLGHPHVVKPVRNSPAKRSSPVPSDIAAVIATIRGSSSASVTTVRPNTFV